MTIPWTLVFRFAAIVGFAVAGWAIVHTYNTAIEQNAQLKKDLKDADDRVTLLESSAAQAEQKMKDLSQLIGEHGEKLAQIQSNAARKASAANQIYKGTTDAKRAVLDTDLPEFGCLFDGSCETAGAGVHR